MSKNTPKRVTTNLPWQAFGMEADRDYLLARWIHSSGGTFHSRAGFFAQQACEKYMKAEMVKSTGAFLKTHRLHKLADECATRDPMFNHKKLREAITVFDDFAELGRYGGFAGKNHANVEVDPGVEVVGAYMWRSSDIRLLDEFAFNIRRKFEYAADRFPDQFAAIIEGRDCMLSDQWRGQPSLKDVLLTQNPLFAEQVPLPDKS